MIAKNSEFKSKLSLTLDRTFSGQAASFQEDGFVMFANARNSNLAHLVISWNGISQAYSVETHAPILLEYLPILKGYPHDVKKYLQYLIYSEHGPTYDSLAEAEIECPNFKNQETFSLCFNAEVLININKKYLFFSAVTGPGPDSEGTVVGIAADGLSTVAKLRVPDATEIFWGGDYQKETLLAFKEFVDTVDPRKN